MKKIISCLLAAALLFALSACGGDNAAESQGSDTAGATVTTTEGNTVTMTAEDLIAAYDANEASFNKLYLYAPIQFTGTIRNIKVDTSVIVESGKVAAGQQKIVFEEGWCLVLGENNTNYDLAQFNAGDVVTVTSSIVGAPYDTDFLKTVSDNTRVLWLVGDDTILGQQHSDIPTVIETLP